jgi:DNA-binding transcriptional MocR family regulator
MKNRALDAETGFTGGSLFSATGELHNYLRLSFAHYHEHDIREGIARLRPLFG